VLCSLFSAFLLVKHTSEPSGTSFKELSFQTSNHIAKRGRHARRRGKGSMRHSHACLSGRNEPAIKMRGGDLDANQRVARGTRAELPGRQRADCLPKTALLGQIIVRPMQTVGSGLARGAGGATLALVGSLSSARRRRGRHLVGERRRPPVMGTSVRGAMATLKAWLICSHGKGRCKRTRRLGPNCTLGRFASVAACNGARTG
jgi:hypothetical protein